MATDSVLREPICIIGAGPAGLINAHVLLQDGFTSIKVLTRDASVGGVWARNRIYPGLQINKYAFVIYLYLSAIMLKPSVSVHDEYRFSAQEMSPPAESETTVARVSGLDMCNYMERYWNRFLKGKVEFTFNTEVLDVSRDEGGTWLVRVEDLLAGTKDILKFSRIILATGVSHW
jgi:cation diffusion facilitator CzcD-associated flavoprotein CzcO